MNGDIVSELQLKLAKELELLDENLWVSHIVGKSDRNFICKGLCAKISTFTDDEAVLDWLAEWVEEILMRG